MLLEDYKIQMKHPWKVATFATWIGGMLAHAYRFFNYLPTWDSLFNFKGTGATVTSGRWFLELVGNLSTNYDLAWVNGVLSLLFINIAVILLVELFEIKSDVNVSLLALLTITFPSVTSTFAFMFTADGYMLAFLLAILGVYLTEKCRFGWILGAICVCLAMSTYQAYLSVTLVCVAVLFAKKFLVDEKKLLQVITDGYTQVVAVALGAVLNRVSTNVIVKLAGTVLTSYQGINDVHLLTLEDTLAGVREVIESFQFHLAIGKWGEMGLYSILNQLTFGILFIYTVLYIWKKQLYKRPLELVALLIVYACIPFFAYIIIFVSLKVSYHALMLMSLCLIYVLVIVCMEYYDRSKNLGKYIKLFSTLVLIVMVYSNILIANYAYFNMNLSYEKSYAVSLDVLQRIEAIDEFRKDTPIAIIGKFDAPETEVVTTTPEIAGVSSDVLLLGEDHYFAMWKHFMGRIYEKASIEDVMQIRASETYANMSVYPYAGSVKLIDGVVVVKLEE